MMHLNGAAKLLAMRGEPQFSYDVGYGIWLKLRNATLSECLRSRKRVPEYISKLMKTEAIAQQDHYRDFFQLMTCLCSLLADHKEKGFIDESMMKQASLLKDEFENRCSMMRHHVSEERPSAEAIAHETNAHATYLAQPKITSWFFVRCARILISDLFVERARTEHNTASPLTLAALENASKYQIRLCKVVEDSVSYYLAKFTSNQASTRIHFGYFMIWVLSILSSLSTTSTAKLEWIAEQAQIISDEFGLRVGKSMAETIERKLQSSAKPIEQSSWAEPYKSKQSRSFRSGNSSGFADKIS